MSNTYCNTWLVKVRGGDFHLQPGQPVSVTTKAGKVKTETVGRVLMTGNDSAGAYALILPESSVKALDNGVRA